MQKLSFEIVSNKSTTDLDIIISDLFSGKSRVDSSSAVDDIIITNIKQTALPISLRKRLMYQRVVNG